MFKVNKLTDYATVVLIDMAQSGLVRPTHAISESTGIPLPTVAKLMKSLVKSGLVVSHRGVRGGYSLDRAASDISVADVIEAVEGPIALTACVDASSENCCYQTQCPMSGKWDKVNGAVKDALREVSLTEMLDDRGGRGGFQESDPQTYSSQQDVNPGLTSRQWQEL